MLDLIYQDGYVPFIGHKEPGSETVPVVESNGMVVASACRSFCHQGGDKPLHPVVRLYLINRKGNVYVQRRSSYKTDYPLYWDCSAAGHVSFGESLPEALFREASEEIGLVDFHPLFLKSYVWESEKERELVAVFATVGDFHPNPDNYEVADGRFKPADELLDMMATEKFAPEFVEEYPLIKDSLLSLL